MLCFSAACLPACLRAYLSMSEEGTRLHSGYAGYDQYEVSIPLEIAADCMAEVRLGQYGGACKQPRCLPLCTWPVTAAHAAHAYQELAATGDSIVPEAKPLKGSCAVYLPPRLAPRSTVARRCGTASAPPPSSASSWGRSSTCLPPTEAPGCKPSPLLHCALMSTQHHSPLPVQTCSAKSRSHFYCALSTTVLCQC